MIVQHNGKKIVFVHVGGNAGTSIEWYLWRLDKGQVDPKAPHFKDGDFEYQDIIRDKGFRRAIGNPHGLLSDHDECDISFAVVRNPYERTLEKYFCSPHSKKAEYHVKGFEAFIEEIYSYKTKFSNEQCIHTRCQSKMLEGVDHVLRFEHLQQDMDAFCIEFGLPVHKLIHCNATAHPKRNIDLYTDWGKEMVYRHNHKIITKYYDNV